MEHNNFANAPKQLQMWFCAECQSVHLRTDNVCLTFTKDEFSQLSTAVFEIYRTEIDTRLGNFAAAAFEEADDVLESDLIA